MAAPPTAPPAQPCTKNEDEPIDGSECGDDPIELGSPWPLALRTKCEGATIEPPRKRARGFDRFRQSRTMRAVNLFGGPPREGSIQEHAGESAKALGIQIELQCIDKLGEPPADLLDESSWPPHL